jgi:small conductance mechanosensitive channel
MSNVFKQDYTALVLGLGASAAQAGVRIVLMLVAGYLAVRRLRVALHRLENLLVRTAARTELVPGAARKRVTTLTGLLLTLGVVAVWLVVAIICLDQLGLDVAPILAGAGIVGLAVGFGAQNLVRDVIAGFFLVLEN